MPLTENEPDAHKPVDCLIVGAGVIGLSAAYFLLRAGHSVSVLDRGEIGQGASHGNCGLMSRSHAPPLAKPGLIPKALRWALQPDAPLYIKPTLNPSRLLWLLRFARRCNWRDFWDSAERKNVLLERSCALFRQIVTEEQIDCDYAPIGHLVAFRDPREFQAYKESQAILHRFGIACELWDAGRVRDEEPALTDSVIGAAFKADDAHFRPSKYVLGLAQRIRDRGAKIHTQQHVQAIRIDGQNGVAVHTGAKTYRARALLLATGAHAPELGKQLGLKLRIEPAKGYSITMSPTKLMPKYSIVFHERGVAATPFAQALRLGSTYEFSGFDERYNPIRFAALRRAAGEYLREPAGAVVEEEWSNFRPMTVDGLPYIEASKRFKSAFVAAGHGTLGMTMSAGSGEIAANQISAYLRGA